MLLFASACASASYICVGWKPCLCSDCMIWLFDSPCDCMLTTCDIGTSDGICGGMPSAGIGYAGASGAFFLNMSSSAMVQLFFVCFRSDCF